MHSTSVRTVKSSSSVRRAFPSVFLRQRLVLLIILSKKPPHHGTFSWLNFHWIFLYKRKDMTSGSLKIFVSWVAAALNVFTLSDMISSGIPLRATNLRRHRMNAWPWVVRLGVSSVCMAIVLPQVKRQMYTLVTCSSFPKTVFANSDPAKFPSCACKGVSFLESEFRCIRWLLDLVWPSFISSTHYAVVDLFSDDLPSLGEPETRSQLC